MRSKVYKNQYRYKSKSKRSRKYRKKSYKKIKKRKLNYGGAGHYFNLFYFPIDLGQMKLGMDTTARILNNKLSKVGIKGRTPVDANINLEEINKIVSTSGKKLKLEDEEFRKVLDSKVFEKLNDLYKAISFSNFLKNKHNVIIGGDHSIAIPSIAHSLNNNKNLKVIYFDAHPDINSQKESKSKNIHGMPLAYLTGLEKEDDCFKSNCKYIENYLNFENLLYVGIRAIDPYEKRIIKEKKIRVFSVNYFNENTPSEIHQIFDAFIGDDPFHISFDIDCLDPLIEQAKEAKEAKEETGEKSEGIDLRNIKHIPCTGTVVIESDDCDKPCVGLDFDKTKQALNYLIDKPNFTNIDISELNLHLCNNMNRTKSIENFLDLFEELFKKINPDFDKDTAMRRS